ncbi:MAG: hypothetical protein ACRCZI_14960 [Cetobacterium sp.]
MSFTLKDEDLFPDCMLPNCSRHKDEGRHAHVLDHQRDVLTCNTKYLYCQGGVGSAKSIAFAARCVKLSLEIDNNSGIVGRKDYKLLYRSAWQDIKACVKKLVRLGYFEKYGIDLSTYERKFYSSKKQGDYSIITFPNDSIMYAVQTKAWEEGLGPSYGWYWIDDAMESSEEMFVGHETSAGLISRLRLPTANFYRDTDGVVESKLSGMVSSNPPPHNHWLHKLFGAQPGIFKIGNDTVTHMRVETFLNPFVGDDYASGIMSIQQKMGRSSDTARRVIFGESLPAYGGVKVYPQFKHQIHVGEFTFNPNLPLITSWDFGLAHPAVIFSNLNKCNYGKNHLISLSELSQLFEVTIYDVYAAYKDHLKEFYSNASRIFQAGDKSGYRQSTNRKDKRGDIRILQSEYNLSFKYGYFDVINSIKYCRVLLNERCECGSPIIQIDKRCIVLIEALEGGYKFPKRRDGSIGDKPIKDKYYDDIADAWRYGIENYVKRGITYRDDVHPSYKKHKPEPKPWDWMEMSSEELMDAILK